ncbi:MAG: LamG domain-containing protein [Deltaproteobacteria bacterium]|nr:LamG domain-containing protein [Deltaproteobacteria bacterium]
MSISSSVFCRLTGRYTAMTLLRFLWVLAACEVPNPAYDPSAGPQGGGGGGLGAGGERAGGAVGERGDGAGGNSNAGGNSDAGFPSGTNASIAYFPFEDPSGSRTFADKSGNGTQALLEGDACTCMSVPGRTGKAISLIPPADGALSGVRLLPSEALQSTNASMTAAAWVYLKNRDSLYYSIVSRRCDDTRESINLTIEYPHISVFSNCLGGNASHLIASNAARLDQWVHVATTFDGKELRLYVNGVLMALGPTLQNTLGHDETESFFIGNNLNGNDPTEPFVGLIDDVALWNRALTAFEVGELWRGTSPLAL